MLLISGAAIAVACAWDYDTVPEELKGVPDVVDAVVGRLAVNPSLYYRVRLERVVKEMKEHPENLDLYDNAGVAADKLGDTDGAIDWMTKKFEQIKTSTLASEILKDHQYRYHANLGTFYAHKWAKQSERSDFTLLKKGIAELETAVKINPDAHFGREIVQIQFLKLFLIKGEDEDDSGYLRESAWRDFIDRTGEEKVRKGLIGIMLLGSGIESPDVIFALGMTANMSAGRGWRSSFAYMVTSRIKELGGGKAMKLFSGSDVVLDSGMVVYESDVNQAFNELRENAKEFRKNRDNFMIAKLRHGQHPDTDPSFWSGYRETPRVNLDKFGSGVPYNLRSSGLTTTGYYGALIGIIVGIPLCLAGLIFLGVVIRRRTG